MHPLWGLLFIVIGLFMLICSLLKTNFIIYRLLVARSKILWGEHVHKFYTGIGAILIILGALIGFNVIW
jgi:hypothetical protein